MNAQTAFVTGNKVIYCPDLPQALSEDMVVLDRAAMYGDYDFYFVAPASAPANNQYGYAIGCSWAEAAENHLTIWVEDDGAIWVDNPIPSTL